MTYSYSCPCSQHTETKKKPSKSCFMYDKHDLFLLGYFHENSQVFMSLKTTFLTSRHSTFLGARNTREKRAK